jgi:tryptophan synthase alpha chain
MNRLIHKIEILRGSGNKALSMFITAGYPSIDATAEIVKTLESSGTDFIELGIPFSDPLADGPVIQQSSDTAIRNGVTIPVVFDIVAAIRSVSDIPIVLMGYINPILSYGIDRFMKTASSKGADGVIVPDIPVEESEDYRRTALKNNLSPIFLTSPTTDDTRIRQIDDASEGFVYCVSVTGVTGRSNGLPPERKIISNAAENK